jgi:LPXTG-site transpeptidase (sortase) family protein
MQYISLIPKDAVEHVHREAVLREKIKKNKARVSLWAGVLVVAVIVVAYPFVPLFMYHVGVFSGGGPETTRTAMGTAENEDEHSEGTILEPKDAAIPSSVNENMLVIPKIGVRMEILGGSNAEYAWNRGAWLEPNTSTPDQGSNTVISAHRFNYRPPHERTLYLLDKLEVGDVFSVYWEGKEYRYRVKSSKITSPFAIHVLEPSDKPMITIYTCNPIFSTRERLVVTAELIQ